MPLRWQLVHEVHEVLGRAVAAGGGVVADGLVAPGTVERVLGDGQQLDMGIAHLLDVAYKFVRQFAVGEVAATFLLRLVLALPATP